MGVRLKDARKWNVIVIFPMEEYKPLVNDDGMMTSTTKSRVKGW